MHDFLIPDVTHNLFVYVVRDFEIQKHELNNLR